jgi:hypothetical protein
LSSAEKFRITKDMKTGDMVPRSELEKAQAELKTALESTGRVLDRESVLLQELHTAEACCAEMREVILQFNVGDYSHEAWERKKRALSSDCGKDFVPRAELDEAANHSVQLENKLNETRKERNDLVNQQKALVEALGKIADIETIRCTSAFHPATQLRLIAQQALATLKQP